MDVLLFFFGPKDYVDLVLPDNSCFVFVTVFFRQHWSEDLRQHAGDA